MRRDDARMPSAIAETCRLSGVYFFRSGISKTSESSVVVGPFMSITGYRQ